MHDLAKTPRSHLDSSSVWVQRVQGAVFVVLLILGAWQGFAALASAPAQRRLAGVDNLNSFLAGRTAAAINYIEAHYLPADHLLRALGGEIRWKIFGSGGPMVALGCDDWLFLTAEGQTYRDGDANMSERATIVGHVGDVLQRRGIELVVAVVPDKERVERTFLCGAPRSAQSVDRLSRFGEFMRAHHRPIINLADTFDRSDPYTLLYYRTDTHWNQTGAALAARVVAAAVKTKLQPGYAYRTVRANTESDGPGDLLRLMSLDLVGNTLPVFGIKLRPKPDRQYLEQSNQTDHPPESTDLLAAGPGDEVVLLGSSFSKNANFQGRLEEALKAPVNNVAELGGGFAGSASAYLQSPTFSDMPPRVIIWEMPERTLNTPMEAADKNLAAFR